MLRKQKITPRSSVRTRQAPQPAKESFRRNVVVFSREQKELAQHQQSVTQRQIERKRSDARRRFKRLCLAAMACIVGVVVVVRMSPSRLTLHTNASTKLTADQNRLYQAAWMQSYRENAPFGQYWLLDEAKFEEAILRAYPEVEDITIEAAVPVGSELRVGARFRQAVFTWRDASGTLQFVDKNGVLFTKDLDAAVDVSRLIAIEDQSGTVLDPGNPVLTTHLVKFVGQLHDAIPLVYPGKKITKVIIPRSTREVQIQVGEIPYLIKLSSERELSEQIQDLKVLVAHVGTQPVQPAQYIDVRIAHKAFYK